MSRNKAVDSYMFSLLKNNSSSNEIHSSTHMKACFTFQKPFLELKHTPTQ